WGLRAARFRLSRVAPRSPFKRAAQHGDQIGGGKRFADIIEGFLPLRRRGRFERTVRGHDYYRQVRPKAAKIAQHIKPGCGAEFEIEQDGVEWLLVTQLHSLSAAHRQTGGITFDFYKLPGDRAEIRVVINNQNSALKGSGHSYLVWLMNVQSVVTT